MSSRLPCDPHPRTTKKVQASAAAVQLLLRRGGSGRAAPKDESIAFFSALREGQHDPSVSGQTGLAPADRREKARRSGGDSELLSTEIGKHDYDWLLTPPATPLCFPAPAVASGSTTALNRLTRATSASYAKSSSPLSLGRRENGNPPSRLVRSSSVNHSSSVNTAAFASSYRPLHVRTRSSASSSIKAPSNASGRSTPATSPRTPATARSAAAPSSPTSPQGNGQVSSSSSGAASQSKGSSSSNSRPSAPTIARPRAPTTGASNSKSTRVASEQPALTTRRGTNAVARSRFGSQLSSAIMSTAQPAQNVVRSSISKPRPLPAAKTKNGTAAISSAASAQSLLSPQFPSRSSSAIAASLSASREGLLTSKRLYWSGDYGQKVNVDKTTPPCRTAGLASAATSSGLTRTGSRKSANADAKRAVNEDRKPTVQQRSIHSSMASRSRLGSASTSSTAGSIARGRWATTQKGKVAVGAARAAEADAFPSTRYDAMLLREDPKNLTWLNGCGDDDGDEDAICGVGLVEGSLELEPFSVTVSGTSGTAS